MPNEKVDLEEFKALRHRFYKLGRARRWNVLRFLGLLAEGEEPLDQDHEKQLLFTIAKNSGLDELEEQIGFQEKEIEEEANEVPFL